MPTSSVPADPAAADWPRALRACVDAFDAFAASAIVFYRLDQSGEPADFELFGMPESMHRTYVARYRMLDPLHPSRCAAGERAVVTLASQLPDERRDASAYWTRFLRRHDVADVVEIWLRDAGRAVGAFSLLRFEAGDTRGGVAGNSTAARFAPGGSKRSCGCSRWPKPRWFAAARAARDPPDRLRGAADLPRGADRAPRARRPLEQGDRPRSRARPADRQDAPDADVPQARRVEPHGTGGALFL